MKSKGGFLKENLPGLEENVPLRDFTTVRLGGPAKFFWRAKNTDDLIKAVRIARQAGVDFFILGGGSNVVFADAGFEGLVIKNEAKNLIFEKDLAVVDSGLELSVLTRQLAEHNLGGIEFLAGIPGTVGGAVWTNAGAFGKSMADVVQSVVILDCDLKIKTLLKEDLKFDYRTSVFKKKYQNKRKRPVILTVTIKLVPKTKSAILRTVENYLKVRSQKFPQEFSAGCVFKNIKNPDPKLLSPKARLLVLKNEIPAGLLLERLGAKKERVGKIEVSEKHANFIVNLGRGKSADFKKLVHKLKKKAKEEFGLNLTEEIEFVGDFGQKPIKKWKIF